jgi:tetratricopeptide (TPR) repeat protein
MDYLQQALNMDLKFYGNNHPALAKEYNSIASIYSTLNNHAKAEEYYQKALTILIDKLGADHPNTKITRENIAFARKKKSK